MLLAVMTFVCCTEEPAPLKIACVGDSITFGSTILNREGNSYPAQLQKMLGAEFDVRNFGVAGATVLNSQESSYVAKSEFQDMVSFAPDVLFLMLGTNDSKLSLRGQMGRFDECYNAIIESVYKASPKCRVVLLTPPKAHNPTSQWGIESEYISKNIIPRVEKIAYARDLEVVNLHNIFDEYDESLMPDRVHPSGLGAAKIARRLYELLTLQTVDYTFGRELDKCVEFHGYRCYEFEYNNNFSRVAVPKIVAKGKPWVMRARFWGDKNFYATDVALLERGFHILYTDVTDLYGSPVAVERFASFIDYAIGRGLNSKCVIEAFSRGGLVGYNYAAQHPERVALVYGDAPVLDFKSWPLGFKPNGFDSKKLLKAYGFESIEQAREYVGNPIDRVKEIARGGFDMLHVCGNADDVVPMSENSTPFIELIESYGGAVKLIVKDGVGHHPHGLSDPTPVVNQILLSTGQFISPSTHPTPGAEYRQMADWVTIADEISELTATNKYDILLLGNSITQGFGSNRKWVRYQPANKFMDREFPNVTWLGAGIAGDRTEHLLYRILHGGYEQCDPKYVILTIGINNMHAGGDSAEVTLDGVIACVEAVEKVMPRAKIILYGTLPAQCLIKECEYISQSLTSYKWSDAVTYVDPFQIFAPNHKEIIKELYRDDMLHLNVKGYEAWCENMRQVVDL